VTRKPVSLLDRLIDRSDAEAAELKLTRNAVFLAKSRVSRRLRDMSKATAP
jgi:hypothetical protein